MGFNGFVRDSFKDNQGITRKPGRKRCVFPSDEIPHLWMHQTQDEARNSTGNIYFKGDTIYSYRDSFPMARLVTNKKGDKAVLYNVAKYSVTTSQHQSRVRQAIPSDTLVFEVPGLSVDPKYPNTVKSTHNENLKHYLTELEGNIAKAARARRVYSITGYLTAATDLRAEALKYAEFFGLKAPKLPDVPEADSEKLAALGKKEKEAAAKLAAETKEKRRIAEEKRLAHEAELERTRPERIQTWRNGGEYQFEYNENIPTMLRIEGSEVHTSRGARFPVRHARRGFNLVQTIVARGKEWQSNGEKCRLGHYFINRIEANGTVHAGCHVVTFEEINRIGPELLVAPDGPEDNADETAIESMARYNA